MKQALIKFVTLIVVAFTAVAWISLSASANTLSEPFAAPNSTEIGYQSVLFQDQIPFEESFSWVGGTNAQNANFVCSNISNIQKCPTLEKFAWHSIMGPCTSLDQMDCIQSITALDSLGKETEAVFESYTNPSHPNLWGQSLAHGIPEGKSISLWKLPSSAGGSSGLMGVDIGQGNSIPAGGDLNNPLNGATGNLGQSLWAYIAPVSITPEVPPKCIVPLLQFRGPKDCLSNSLDLPNANFCRDSGMHSWFNCFVNASANGNQNCFAHTEQNNCVLMQSFLADTKLRVNVRISQEPNGWLHGRVGSPDITIKKLPTGYLLSVQGTSVIVPTLYYGNFWKDLPVQIQKDYSYCGEFKIYGGICSYATSAFTPGTGDPFVRNDRSVPTPWSEDSISALRVWLPLVKDSATASPSLWSIRTLSTPEMNGFSGCFSQGSGLKGMVSTNATAYSQGPPSFTDGVLSYHVGAPHFNADGSVFKGSYSLNMSSDVARCIYGFSKAPVRATVEVITSDGANSVATTAVNESNGFLTMRAENFTFSDPTIKIKISQDTAKQVKISISCSKGKLIKHITGANPTCPSGYKKK